MHGGSGCFAWHPRPKDLKERALSDAPGAVATLYAAASSTLVWGATLGERFIQGEWPPSAVAECINWRELLVLARALAHWSEVLSGKLALVHVDTSFAAVYESHGAGGSPGLIALTWSVKARELVLPCAAVAVHTRGSDNVAAWEIGRVPGESVVRKVQKHGDEEMRSHGRRY